LLLSISKKARNLEKFMEIKKLETFQLSAPLEISFGWSQDTISSRSVGLVKITTDDGIVGWGEGCGGPSAAVVEDILAPLIIGENPINRLKLWQKMFHSLYNANLAVGYGGSAISAIDTALWDITGKILGLPIYDLLGGQIRNSVPVYATGLYYTEGEMPTRLLAEARGYVESGFIGMKTKIGGLKIEDDVKRVKAIRDEIGPDIKLMVDANQAYNASSAIRIGQKLAHLDLVWFEEPVNAQDIDGYLSVKSSLPMAIAGGENLRTRYEFQQFLSRRAYDIVQPDIINVGGISEMRNVAMTANTMGIQVNPHVWGSPIMIAASLHVASTLPPCPPSGNPEPFVQETVMEYDRTPSAIRDDISPETFVLTNGRLEVPTGPGLGITVDEKAVRSLSS
jgi:D-galactarolactone cycloisomerase|tara:strand:- start:7445 stop:8629 length:1185 start_codon:yes stop_codon:yes gene_type:complete